MRVFCGAGVMVDIGLLSELSDEELACLKDWLSAGTTASTPLAGKAGSCLQGVVDTLKAVKVAPEIIVAAATLLLRDRAARAAKNKIELVVSGQAATEIPTRDTLVVMDELFMGATRSLLISSFAIYQGKQVLKTLAENMRRRPELVVEMFLNIERSEDAVEHYTNRVADFLRSFREKQWPGGCRLPIIYYYADALRGDSSMRASMHAKVIVCDDDGVLVSSANLTTAAQYRNVEIGLLVKSYSLARSVCQHFEFLKQCEAVLPAAL